MPQRSTWATVSLFSLLLAPSLALATDLPKRKPGLWEIKTAMSVLGGQQMTMSQCIDEKTDADLLSQATRQQGDCETPRITRAGERTTIETTCKVNGGTASTRGEFTGQYESHYQGEVVTRFDPPQHGMQEARMQIDARWTGPCPAGQKPGSAQMQLPGVGNINLPEMLKNIPGIGQQ
ncbi:MAG: DUF3617 family protein [Rhodocyclaceae bacterium]|nr:DUF3617 family protein [Rhodocyclaceae bacterium]